MLSLSPLWQLQKTYLRTVRGELSLYLSRAFVEKSGQVFFGCKGGALTLGTETERRKLLEWTVDKW
jgi:hypothetical protein